MVLKLSLRWIQKCVYDDLVDFLLGLKKMSYLEVSRHS